MSTYHRRVQTLQVLLSGSPPIASHANEAYVIDGELEEAGKTVKIPQLPRRRLLQILHTTRSLDSSLACFLNHHGITPNRKSLGGYLIELETIPVPGPIGALPAASRTRYQQNIVKLRNRYMHEAGAFPATDGEIMTLLSEMHSCLTDVLNL